MEQATNPEFKAEKSPAVGAEVLQAEVPGISGLTYIANYLSPNEQAAIAEIIDQQEWLSDLKRRVQHYGYRYNYALRAVDASQFLGPLPAWAATLANRLHDDGYASAIPDQLIINEYEPGQGISRHVDCIPCFGDTILSISLLSSCVMVFEPHRVQAKPEDRIEVWLEPGSLVVMQGPARYAWTHSIPGRKSDVRNGQSIRRTRRLSLTFRKIIQH